MKKPMLLSLLALAAAVALGGCAVDPESADPAPSATSSPTATGSTHGTDHHGAPETPENAATGNAAPEAAAAHNSADTMFAQMMIPHHEQAVTMSEMILAKTGIDPRVSELAEAIQAAQGPEIRKMEDWLAAWDEPREMSGEHPMDGMLSPEDLAELDAARDAAAARLFLQQMIAHHEGAVAMARTEVEDGSNPGAVELATAIIADQNAEIEQMNNLLRNL